MFLDRAIWEHIDVTLLIKAYSNVTISHFKINFESASVKGQILLFLVISEMLPLYRPIPEIYFKLGVLYSFVKPYPVYQTIHLESICI